MQFESSDEAFKFYNNYALIVGFSIVMAHNYHSRDKKMMGQVTRMTFKCQRRGIDKKQENKSNGKQKPGVQSSTTSRKRTSNNTNTDEAAPTPAARKKRSNVIDKTNCPAEMVITLKNGVWVVTRLNLEHNHNLLSPQLSKLL
jgi:hypothetical protein